MPKHLTINDYWNHVNNYTYSGTTAPWTGGVYVDGQKNLT